MIDTYKILKYMVCILPLGLVCMVNVHSMKKSHIKISVVSELADVRLTTYDSNAKELMKRAVTFEDLQRKQAHMVAESKKKKHEEEIANLKRCASIFDTKTFCPFLKEVESLKVDDEDFSKKIAILDVMTLLLNK